MMHCGILQLNFLEVSYFCSIHSDTATKWCNSPVSAADSAAGDTGETTGEYKAESAGDTGDTGETAGESAGETGDTGENTGDGLQPSALTAFTAEFSSERITLNIRHHDCG